MSQPKDAFTIVIFRGTTASPVRFTCSRSVVKKAMIVAAVLIFTQVTLLSLYLVRAGEVGELRGLRDEVVTARQQTTAFSKAVDELKRRLMAMQEVNQRLRVMLGITAHKPEDLFNGQGGEETPLLDNEMVPTSDPEDPEQIQLSDDHIFPLPDEQLLAGDDLARRVKEELARLREQAEDQERTLEILAQAAKEKADRWDHTPSIWPVKGWITSGFGARISPFTGQRAFHDALDIGAAPNTPVLSPAAGRVYSTGFDPRMGNVVSIDHGFGIRTQYGHLAKILVTRGQKIERGDAVGLLGSTGRTTGPHLHYLVKVNGRSVNPMRYILN